MNGSAQGAQTYVGPMITQNQRVIRKQQHVFGRFLFCLSCQKSELDIMHLISLYMI